MGTSSLALIHEGIVRFAMKEYVKRAMASPVYGKLGDVSFSARIPKCKGVIAFGKPLRECKDPFRSTAEDWIPVGVKIGQRLPVIDAIDLNRRRS